MVFALIGLRGLVLAVDNPARQSFVIEIVGPERVVNAVSLNSVLIHSARITGPAIAGVVIALGGVALCFAAQRAQLRRDARRARPDEPRAAAPAGAEAHPRRRPPRASATSLGTPELRTPLLLMLVLGTLGFNFQVIIPLLADRTFGGDVSAYSLLMIAMGVGSITGALTLGARTQASKDADRRRGRSASASPSLLAAAAPTLPLEMAALGLLGVCSVTFAAGINSGLQLAAAPEMRGRVMALYSIVFLGSTPIGGPITGWLGETVGPRAPLVLAGVAALAASAMAAIWWRERSRPPADRPAEREARRRRVPRRREAPHDAAVGRSQPAQSRE